MLERGGNPLFFICFYPYITLVAISLGENLQSVIIYKHIPVEIINGSGR